MMRWVLSLGLVLSVCRVAECVEPVQATIQTEEAWTGQPVLIVVTLYSPGPFSGTASFDLPELPSTAIVKPGSPLVGSETIDDESWLTQRHELNVYTQLTGEIVIPSFSVRFEGKQTFTSDPKPMQGKTPELKFVSRRPPGTRAQDEVMSAENLTVEQSWLPEEPDGAELRAGDVIERRIALQASGTTAMLMTPARVEAPKNVRVYESDPDVVDRNERGEARSTRIETVKYQFEQPGTYDLPAIDYVWWDYQNKELRTESLTGSTITVTGPASADLPTADTDSESPATSRWWMLLVVVVSTTLFRPARRVSGQLVRWWNSPKSVARRKLLAACRGNDASAAYAAVLTWQRLSDQEGFSSQPDDDVQAAYRQACDALAAHLYGSETERDLWNGQALRSAFLRIARRTGRQTTQHLSPLAMLNPIGPSESPS